jgi:hypothetical protein
MNQVKHPMVVLQAMDPSMTALDDQAFLRQAYLRLLGRGADREGMNAYLQQLQQGVSRHEIFQDLAASEEAQRYEARRQHMRRGVASTSPMSRGLALVPSSQGRLVRSTDSWGGPTPSVANAQELLELEGVEFIKAAYVTLLGREVDAEGGLNYLKRLRDGWSRMSIVKGLYLSKEGQAHGNPLPGLAQALARYNKAQRRSWSGWYQRSVLGVESDLPMERHLRATHLALRQS